MLFQWDFCFSQIFLKDVPLINLHEQSRCHLLAVYVRARIPVERELLFSLNIDEQVLHMPVRSRRTAEDKRRETLCCCCWWWRRRMFTFQNYSWESLLMTYAIDTVRRDPPSLFVFLWCNDHLSYTQQGRKSSSSSSSSSPPRFVSLRNC